MLAALATLADRVVSLCFRAQGPITLLSCQWLPASPASSWQGGGGGREGGREGGGAAELWRLFSLRWRFDEYYSCRVISLVELGVCLSVGLGEEIKTSLVSRKFHVAGDVIFHPASKPLCPIL